MESIAVVKKVGSDQDYDLSACSNSSQTMTEKLSFPFPKHDLFVSGWLLSHTDIDISDINVWNKINSSVSKHWDVDFGAIEWQTRWLDHLDQKVHEMHSFHISSSPLPKMEENDSLKIRLQKANDRLSEFQRQYAKLCVPLSLTFVTCRSEELNLQQTPCNCKGNLTANCDPPSLEFQTQHEEHEPCQKKRRSSETEPASRMHFNPDVFGVKGSLFKDLHFYLPPSVNLLKEIIRWKVEMLIWLHGGKCSVRETDIITKNAIVLATGDERDNLWKIARWYECKIYKPSVIEHCVVDGITLDHDVLQRYKWYTRIRR